MSRVAEPEIVERRVAAMGTALDIAVAADTREAALSASERAVAEVRRVEDLLTTWRDDSPLARLNTSSPGSPFPVGSELAALLEQVLAWSPRTGGAFDAAIAPLVRAWDLRGAGRIPTGDELAAARAASDPTLFRVRITDAQAERLSSAAGIEEGGWGKGYALDAAREALTAAKAQSAMLDLGGQVLAVGRDPRGRDWTVSVSDPFHRERPAVTLAVANCSVSTSGNSERSRVVGGRRLGHILDPSTGEPASDFGSVTVIAPTGLVADVLSTAFFVLGPHRGLALSERLRRQSVDHEVLFLSGGAEGFLRAESTPGMSRYVRSANPARVRGGSSTSAGGEAR